MVLYVNDTAPFLRAFAQLRKWTASIGMSVCPSAVRMEKLVSNTMDFYEIRCLSVFCDYIGKVKSFTKTRKE